MTDPSRTIPTTLLVISDRAAEGKRDDETAALMMPALLEAGFDPVSIRVVPDDREEIAAAIRASAGLTPLVLTTGGTGIADRDVTPEATRDVIDYEIPGLGEEMRRRSRESTIHALGSRALAGVVGRAIVVNLPGRPRGALDCFSFVGTVLPHLVSVRQGPVSDDSHLSP